ncbi:hypothetical protein [Streptomyces phaeochromogenes]
MAHRTAGEPGFDAVGETGDAMRRSHVADRPGFQGHPNAPETYAPRGLGTTSRHMIITILINVAWLGAHLHWDE